VLDISESGIGFSWRERLRTGSTASLWFEVPGSKERIEASGVVAWTTSSGRAGIRFLHISKPAQGLLNGWLERAAEERALRLRVEARAANDPEVKAAELAIISRQLELEDALSLIAERARTLTRADGAAIALMGDIGFVCRATTGNAPDLGVSLRPDSGLSGECIRAGKIVRCDDTEEDPRADKVACRALELRSTVIVPVTGVIDDDEQVTGLLEVLSSSPRNFAGRDVLLLRQFAALVNRIVVAAENNSLNTKAFAATAAAAQAQAPARVRSSVAMAPPPDEGDKQRVQVPSPTACDVCGHDNLPAATTCENCDVPLPAAVQRHPEAAAVKVQVSAPVAVDEFVRKAQAIATPRKSVPQGTLLFFAAVLLLLSAVGYGGWRYWQSKENAVVAKSTPVAPAPAAGFANTPAEIFPATQRAEPAGKLLQSSSPDVTVVVPAKTKSPKPPARSKAQPSVEEAELRALPTVEAPVTAPMVHVLEPPPSVVAAAVPEQAPLRVSRGVDNPVLLKKFAPTYPPMAKQRHLHGTVVLQATIERNGRIGGVRLESGDRLLADAAIQAVRQWVYKPARLDGQPVEVQTRIIINFAMP
jgi:TonB family protein